MKSVVRHFLKSFKETLNPFTFVWNTIKYTRHDFKGRKMVKINKAWKELHKTKQLQAKHVVEKAILRSMDKTDDPKRAVDLIFKDLLQSFSPRTNENALNNGYEPLKALKIAITLAYSDAMYSEIFGVELPLGSDLSNKYFHFSRELFINRNKLDEYYNRKYVYTFVCQDISPEYQLVQAAHATYKAGFYAIGGIDPDNIYFTVVGVDKLTDVVDHLLKRGIKYHAFFEPDIGNQMTALTTEPIPIRERGDLLKYKLLRFNKVVD